jgi:anti-anti-sigma factor
VVEEVIVGTSVPDPVSLRRDARLAGARTVGGEAWAETWPLGLVRGEEADMRPQADGWTLPGAITIEDEGGLRVLCLRGEVDSAVVARFRQEQASRPVVVDAIDAQGVSFISSTGLAVMIRCVEASLAAGAHPVLRASSHPVDRLLRMFGMDDLFPPAHDAGDRAEPRG